MSLWFQASHHNIPYMLKAGYSLEGEPLKGSTYFSTAFVAPLGVAAMNLKSQQQWLNDIFDAVKEKHQNYYEDSLNLISMLTMTANFWLPSVDN